MITVVFLTAALLPHLATLANEVETCAAVLAAAVFALVLHRAGRNSSRSEQVPPPEGKHAGSGPFHPGA